MTSLNSRSRLISFRLTEEEREVLQRKCLGMGERSLSNFARSTLLRQANSGDANFGGDLATIGAHLWELHRTLRHLSDYIERLLGVNKCDAVDESVIRHQESKAASSGSES